jgi:protein gp37
MGDFGGESGDESGPYQYRPCKIEWIQRAIHVLQTQTQTKVFVKQLGSYFSKEMGLKDKMGGNIEEFPLELQVRDFPIFNLAE